MERGGEERCGGYLTPTHDGLQEMGEFLKKTLDISFELCRVRRVYPEEEVWAEEVWAEEKGVHAQGLGMESAEPICL